MLASWQLTLASFLTLIPCHTLYNRFCSSGNQTYHIYHCIVATITHNESFIANNGMFWFGICIQMFTVRPKRMLNLMHYYFRLWLYVHHPDQSKRFFLHVIVCLSKTDVGDLFSPLICQFKLIGYMVKRNHPPVGTQYIKSIMYTVRASLCCVLVVYRSIVFTVGCVTSLVPR